MSIDKCLHLFQMILHLFIHPSFYSYDSIFFNQLSLVSYNFTHNPVQNSQFIIPIIPLPISPNAIFLDFLLNSSDWRLNELEQSFPFYLLEAAKHHFVELKESTTIPPVSIANTLLAFKIYVQYPISFKTTLYSSCRLTFIYGENDVTLGL